MSAPKFLFILKYRDNYNEFSTSYEKPYSHFSSGLYNSARFVTDMLTAAGVDCKLVQVEDNNSIDREVTLYRPTHVIIEAFWVVPEKFEILTKLHPNVVWIIRGHSEIPFLANEGIAVDWLCRYVKYPSVYIATNSKDSLHDLRIMIQHSNPEWTGSLVKQKVLYMPNYYPVPDIRIRNSSITKNYVDIACFGAIRPLKNNLTQAIAALDYAKICGKELRFHINGTRSEQGGSNNIKNIRALFDHTPHKLIEHNWMPHEELLKVLRDIDISMAVSFTESFNIVAADSVVSDVALVCSPEVYWSSRFSQADPTSTADIVRTMLRVTHPFTKRLVKSLNFKNLKNFSEGSKEVWLDWVSEESEF